MYQSALAEKQSATYLPPPQTFDSHSFSTLFFIYLFFLLFFHTHGSLFEHFDP